MPVSAAIPARLTVRAESWPIAGRFTISRGSKTAADVVVVELHAGSASGRGECVPYPRYGETVPGVVAALEALAPQVARGLSRDALQTILPPGAARNALDCALWDLEAKHAGVPVWRLVGLPEPGPLATAETLSLDTPEAMAAKAATLADRPLLKLKVGGEGVLERVAAVREAAPGARLIVDANEAWTLERTREWLPELAALGVALVEQPLPAGRDEGLSALAEPAVPLCADESVHATDGLEALLGRYQVVNIKLDKTGGLTEALRLRRQAETLDFGIMVGCMVGTSLAMAPAVLVAQGAAFVDLDGPLMLREDRTGGLRYRDGWLLPPESALWG